MKVLIIGNIGSGKTTIGKEIQKFTGYKFVQIDQLREKYLTEHVSEEYYCLYEFLKSIENNSDIILEFTGVGCHKYAVKRALQLSKDKILIVLCKNRNFEFILERIENKEYSYTNPFDINIKEHIYFVSEELKADLKKTFWNCKDFKFTEIYMDDLNDIQLIMEKIKKSLN